MIERGSLAARSRPWLAAALAALGSVSAGACAGRGDRARYPAREPGCAVKQYAGASPVPMDELGTVEVDCASQSGCERKLLDEACRRGANVVWGLGENALDATRRVAHAAHTLRTAEGPRARGCTVMVFADAPPMATENIGPVAALCDQDDTRDVCLRELEDQTCQLGGDVLWQVEGPAPQGNKQRMTGRAAHTR